MAKKAHIVKSSGEKPPKPPKTSSKTDYVVRDDIDTQVVLPDGESLLRTAALICKCSGVDIRDMEDLGSDFTNACRALVYFKIRYMDMLCFDNEVATLGCSQSLGIDILEIFGWQERSPIFRQAFEFLDKTRRKVRASNIEALLTTRARKGWVEEKKWTSERTGKEQVMYTRKFDNRLGMMLMQSGDEVYLKDGDKPVGVSWQQWRAMLDARKKGQGEEGIPTVTLNSTRHGAMDALKVKMQ